MNNPQHDHSIILISPLENNFFYQSKPLRLYNSPMGGQGTNLEVSICWSVTQNVFQESQTVQCSLPRNILSFFTQVIQGAQSNVIFQVSSPDIDGIQ